MNAIVWEHDDRKVAALLEGGASPNSGRGGLTPLVAACRASEATIVRLLIDRGANPNLPDQSGDTPLMAAVASKSTQIVTLLLENGADPNQYDEEGFGAIDVAARVGDTDSIRVLCSFGANAGHRDAQGRLAAHYAIIERDDVGVLEALLECGLRFEIEDLESLLDYARRMDRQNWIRRLRDLP